VATKAGVLEDELGLTDTGESAEPLDPEALRERIEDLLETAELDDVGGRPALRKLIDGQTDLLVDLLVGFDAIHELVSWFQEVTIYTLGQLEDQRFIEILADSNLVSALLRGSEWGSCSGLRPATARESRRALAMQRIIPAAHGAVRAFRWSAVERVDHLDEDGEDAVEVEDVDDQDYPAMRPALAELEENQSWALDRLLEGFHTPEEITIWSSRVIESSYAKIDVDRIQGITTDLVLRSTFTTRVDDEDAEESTRRRALYVRIVWAAKTLLPAFNRASAAIADRSTEVVAATGERIEPGSLS
jgi:hypothetical protein